MSDPKLKACSVVVRHEADDGYWSEKEFKIFPSHAGRLPPERPFIGAIEELARLTALFGFDEEALKAFNDARERVFEWRKNRQPQEES